MLAASGTLKEELTCKLTLEQSHAKPSLSSHVSIFLSTWRTSSVHDMSPLLRFGSDDSHAAVEATSRLGFFQLALQFPRDAFKLLETKIPLTQRSCGF